MREAVLWPATSHQPIRSKIQMQEGRMSMAGYRHTEPERSANTGADKLIVCLFVGWLLNVPATCECISGTDLHRQFLRAATLR